MKKWIYLSLGLLALAALAATVAPGRRISGYWYVGAFDDNDILIAERVTPFPATNVSAKWIDLAAPLTNSMASTSYVNTATGTLASLVFVTNYVTTLSATQNVGRLRYLVPSTTTTQQVDVAAGPQAYYMTNMVTNIVFQLTNVWMASVTNRVLDFYFTGATNNGPNYTASFICPNPAGVVFRWGALNPTNGASSFSVTNNHGAGASLTPWDTNQVEGYYSPVL